MILMAQAVPTATRLPCVTSVPIGWRFLAGNFHTGRASFWFGLDPTGSRVLTVVLTPRCDVSRAEATPTDEPGTDRYDLPIMVRPQFEEIRSYVFPGGCVTYAFAASAGTATRLTADAGSALSFLPRTALVDEVARQEHLLLCGAGVRCGP